MQMEGAHYHTLVFKDLCVGKGGIWFLRTFCAVIGRGICHCLSKGLLKDAICISFHLEFNFGFLLRVVKV